MEVNKLESSNGVDKNSKNLKAKKVAQDFEAFFVNFMFKEMSKNINTDGFNIESNGSKMFQSMYYEEISNNIAQKSDFGIEKIIYDKIKLGDSSGYDDVINKLKNDEKQNFSSSLSYNGSGLNVDKVEKKEIFSTKGNKREYIESVVNEASQKYGVDSSLIMAIIETESNFNSKAKSPVGAKGLMQLMDPTAKEVGVKNVWSIRENVMGGTKYYSRLEKVLGDKKLALAAYNAGIGNVRKYGGIPPFKETQNYVGKVIASEKKYTKEWIWAKLLNYQIYSQA